MKNVYRVNLCRFCSYVVGVLVGSRRAMRVLSLFILISIINTLAFAENVELDPGINVNQDDNGRITVLDSKAKQTIWEFPPDILGFESTKFLESGNREKIFYGWGYYFFEIDRNTGKILKRVYLGDRIDSIEKLSDEKIKLSLRAFGSSSFTYQRTYQNGKIIEPVYDSITTQMHQEAVNVLPELFKEDTKKRVIFIKQLQDFSLKSPTEVIEIYSKSIEKDPTNPWYYLYIGQSYLQLDNKEAAESYFSKAFQSAKSIYEHLFLGHALDLLLQYSWADKEYEEAYRLYLDKGFNPELSASLLSPVLSLKGLASKHLDVGRKERFVQIINWSKKFGPYAEFEYYFNLLYVEWLKKNNMFAEAKKIKKGNKANEGMMLGGGPYLTLIADQCIFLMSISGIIFWLVLISFVLRYRKQRLKNLAEIGIVAWKDKIRHFVTCLRYNTITYMQRKEKMVMISLILFASLAAATATSAIVTVGVLASTPLKVVSGRQGHPSAIQYFEKSTKNYNTDGALYTLAYSYQSDKRYDDAISLYKKILDTSKKAKAHNNLGVIYQDRGEIDKAKSEYSKALDADKNLVSAYYNLGQLNGDISMIEKAKSLGQNQITFHEMRRIKNPMLAQITNEERNEAIIGAKNWYSPKLILPYFIKLFTGEGQHMAFEGLESYSQDKGEKNSEPSITQSNRIKYPALSTLIFLIFGISLLFTPRKKDVSISSSNSIREKISYFLIPGIGHIERGRPFIGVILLYFALWFVVVQLMFRIFGFPGILTKLAMPRFYSLVDLNIPTMPIIIQSDLVWWTLCHGSLFMLIGVYIFNFISLRKIVSK